MWIARDKDGVIRMFKTKPYRRIGFDYEEYWHSNDKTIIEIPTDWDLGIEISWEDEPIEIEINKISDVKLSSETSDKTIVLTSYYENYEKGRDWFIGMLINQAGGRYKNYTEKQLEEVWQNHIKEEYDVDEIWDTVQCDGYTKVIFPMRKYENQHHYDRVCETKEYIDNKIKELCG